jgi:hypothetical protein
VNNQLAFRFRVDVSQIAESLGTTRDMIEDKVVSAVETLSASAHAYIVNLAKEHFSQDDFKRQFFLGIGRYGKDAHGQSARNPMIDQTVKNVRWNKVTDGIWVVELDENVKWLEEGRQETFMGEWLLKPGAKGVKRAKDGSLYRVIPFKHTESGGGKLGDAQDKPGMVTLIQQAAKKQNVSLSKIERNSSGEPKVGILHKLDITSRTPQTQAPDLFSKPRTPEAAAQLNKKLQDIGQTGLNPHGGIFHLAGAVVSQRLKKNSKGEIMRDKKGKAKAIKETVTFRVISSKHKIEGNRWMYPKVEGLNSLQKAHDWANEEWKQVVKKLEEGLSN